MSAKGGRGNKNSLIDLSGTFLIVLPVADSMAYFKKKLDSIEFGANNYVHPEKHAPTIIAQDKDNRFVTDADIINWNNKKDQKDIVCGTGIFNGVEGTVILHELGGTNYAVSITILDDPTDVGTIFVEPDNYSCVVKNTGSNKTSSFTYTLIKYYK